MNYIEEVNPLTTAFKRDLETEFPDLTASFSGLDVGNGVEKVRENLLRTLSSISFLQANQFSKDESSPESIEHRQGHDPQKGCFPVTLEPARTNSMELSSGFATRDSILSHEWLELPEEPLHVEGIEGVDFSDMQPFLSTLGDESFGDMFRLPGGPGTL